MPRIVAGIDEAGYGPTLGPLVVSAACLVIERDEPDAAVWSAIRSGLARRDDSSAPLRIDDSKKLYSSGGGLGRLEEAVLAALTCMGHAPDSFRSLIEQLGADPRRSLDGPPWFAGADLELPVDGEPEAVMRKAARLGSVLAPLGVSLEGIESRLVTAPELNRMLVQCEKKSNILFSECIDLIESILARHPGVDVTIYADKHGGRDYYARLLETAFFGATARPVEESRSISTYQLDLDGRAMRISFIEKGETHHLPIALASMCSKYVRELSMAVFNAFWRVHCPDVRATAGYYTDAMRFLGDVEAARQRLGITRDALVRDK